MLRIIYYPTRNKRVPFSTVVSGGLAAAEVIANLCRSDEDLEHQIKEESLLQALAGLLAGTILGHEYPAYLRIERIKEETHNGKTDL